MAAGQAVSAGDRLGCRLCSRLCHPIRTASSPSDDASVRQLCEGVHCWHALGPGDCLFASMPFIGMVLPCLHPAGASVRLHAALLAVLTHLVGKLRGVALRDSQVGAVHTMLMPLRC